MADVYEARHQGLGRSVALKILKSPCAADRGAVVSHVRRACRGIRTRMRVPTDLFAPRSIAIGQSIQRVAARSQVPRRAAAADEQILALSADGLSLREIAGRAGVSHETVRRRVREAASGA